MIDQPAGLFTDFGRIGAEEPRLDGEVVAGDCHLANGAIENGHMRFGLRFLTGVGIPLPPCSLLGKVNLGLFDLRDKTVMGFDPLKVGRIEIENHGKQFTLSRDAAGNSSRAAMRPSSPLDDPAASERATCRLCHGNVPVVSENGDH